MAGINGKNGRFIKKLEVAESRIPALGFKKVRFKHEAALGDEEIDISSLTTPADATTNGFVQPSGAVLASLNLQQYRDNLVVQSSLRGIIDDYVDYVVPSNSKIRLLAPAEEGEIFTVTVDHVPRTGNTMVDATPIVSTGTLTAGSTDFNVGTPFEVGKFPTSQVGAVMVILDGQVQARNTGNSSSVLDGNYYEVHASGGVGTVIRFNSSDPVNDRNVIVVSVGAYSERPSESQIALIEALQGQIDSMVPTLAALAGVAETTFQATPNAIDLKAFGDKVLAIADLEIFTEENVFSAVVDSTGAIVSQSSSFIQSINKSATGTYDITFVPGLFTVAPTVVAFRNGDGGSSGMVAETPTTLATTSGVTIRVFQATTNTAFDRGFSIMVQRQGADYKAKQAIKDLI